MGTREFRSYARMARPIFTERDYATVRRLVTQRARTFFFVEAERLEALIRELTDYEGRCAETDPGCSVGAVFEVSALLGIRLFDLDRETLTANNQIAAQTLTLLPSAARPTRKPVKDDF